MYVGRDFVEPGPVRSVLSLFQQGQSLWFSVGMQSTRAMTAAILFPEILAEFGLMLMVHATASRVNSSMVGPCPPVVMMQYKSTLKPALRKRFEIQVSEVSNLNMR
jgi:hypothetical protein